MKSHAYLGLIGISLAAFLTAIDFAIVNTALPSIQASLHASLLQLQWMMNIYSLVICAGMVTMGKLADLLGRRIVLVTGIFVFAAASLLAGIVDNLPVIILARALQGLGSAIIVPCSLSLISNLFPAKQRSKAIGIWSAFNGIGFAIGPVLGGVLVSALSWRWVFFIVIPFAIISLIMTLLFIPKVNANHQQKMDFCGFIFLTLGISCLVFSLIQGPSWGWLSPILITIDIIAIASFITLYCVEQKTKHPIINFHYFVNRQFITSALANGAVVAAAVVGFFLLPLYLQTIRNETAMIVGMMLLPITAAMTISSPLVEKLVQHFSEKQGIVIGLLFLLIAFVLQAVFKANSTTLIILIAFILFGLGWGTIWGSATNTAINAFPEQESGSASGLLWTLQNIMGSIGLALCISFFRVFLKQHMWQGIHSLHLTTTTAQTTYLASLAQDPEEIGKLMHVFNSETAQAIMHVFKVAFMSSYSMIMWSLSIAIAMIMLIVITFFRPQQQQQ